MGPPPRRPSPEKAVAEQPRNRATVSEAARPESRPRRLTSRRARAQDARGLPPGFAFFLPPDGPRGPSAGVSAGLQGQRRGAPRRTRWLGVESKMRGAGAAGLCPLGTGPPPKRPRPPPPLLTGGSARADALEAAVPALWPGGPVETDTDTLSPALVTARGQEPEPRSPPASITAHTQRCSVQTKKIQNGKRPPPPSKGEQGTRARHRHTQPCAEQAHPDDRRTDARGRPALAGPPFPAGHPASPRSPPARRDGWGEGGRAGGGGEKGSGGGGRKERQQESSSRFLITRHRRGRLGLPTEPFAA